jgi:hypothetical protein
MTATNKDFQKRLEFDPEKVNRAYEKLVQIFQDEKLTVGEIIIAYGNLGYTLGASVEGFKEKGPTIDELNKMYYSNPTLGVALMIQGITVTSWYENWEKQQLNKVQGNQGES